MTQPDAGNEPPGDAGDNPFHNPTDAGPPPFFLTSFGYEPTTCMGGQMRYTSTVPATCVLRYGLGEEGGPDEVMCAPLTNEIPESEPSVEHVFEIPQIEWDAIYCAEVTCVDEGGTSHGPQKEAFFAQPEPFSCDGP